MAHKYDTALKEVQRGKNKNMSESLAWVWVVTTDKHFSHSWALNCLNLAFKSKEFPKITKFHSISKAFGRL